MQSGRHSSTLQRETQLLLDVARKDRRRYSETAVSVGEVAWNPKLMQNMLDNIILPNKECLAYAWSLVPAPCQILLHVILSA